MKILIASDHAGYYLKEELKHFLEGLGYGVEDFGNKELDESDDYPDFIKPLAEEISKNPNELKGIVLGGSGQGEAIVANRFSSVRAVVLHSFSENIIKLSRQHNDANVLSLGARFLSEDEAKKAVKIWLETIFDKEGENIRHLRRIQKIDEA